MTTVLRWSGREIRALREARRMSIREFAAHLGVSERMVSKWEAAGARIRPRPFIQQMLDTSLTMTSDEVWTRFELLTVHPAPVHSDLRSSLQRPHCVGCSCPAG
jgi:transcriptional regulator with XRE-family HTH domain